MATVTYGDISPKVAGVAAKELLTRATPLLVIEKFCQAKPLPSNSTKQMIFRRYNSLALATTPLTEGVTPTGKTLTKTDVPVTLQQYGDWVEISDVIADTHDDPVLQETMGLLGEQAAETLETLRFNVIKAGTSVKWANGGARNTVNTKITTTLQRQVIRELKKQNARQFTQVIKSTPSYGTEPVAPAYIALCHTDCINDIYDMAGFVPVEKYGNYGAIFEGEIGKVEGVRYITSTVFKPWVDAGGAKGTMLSTTGTNADVYPVIFLARNAVGTVPLKGKNAITPMVLNPNTPRGGDYLGQRGSAAWKTYSATIILNDAWMYRLEVAVTA